MYIKLDKIRLQYVKTTEDTFILAEVPNSTMSYETPIIVRTVDELESWFGKNFSSYDYFVELLNNSISLYLYKPTKLGLIEGDDYIDVSTYTIDPEVYPSVEYLPQPLPEEEPLYENKLYTVGGLIIDFNSLIDGGIVQTLDEIPIDSVPWESLQEVEVTKLPDEPLITNKYKIGDIYYAYVLTENNNYIWCSTAKNDIKYTCEDSLFVYIGDNENWVDFVNSSWYSQDNELGTYYIRYNSSWMSLDDLPQSLNKTTISQENRDTLLITKPDYILGNNFSHPEYHEDRLGVFSESSIDHEVNPFIDLENVESGSLLYSLEKLSSDFDNDISYFISLPDPNAPGLYITAFKNPTQQIIDSLPSHDINYWDTQSLWNNLVDGGYIDALPEVPKVGQKYKAAISNNLTVSYTYVDHWINDTINYNWDIWTDEWNNLTLCGTIKSTDEIPKKRINWNNLNDYNGQPLTELPSEGTVGLKYKIGDIYYTYLVVEQSLSEEELRYIWWADTPSAIKYVLKDSDIYYRYYDSRWIPSLDWNTVQDGGEVSYLEDVPYDIDWDNLIDAGTVEQLPSEPIPGEKYKLGYYYYTYLTIEDNNYIWCSTNPGTVKYLYKGTYYVFYDNSVWISQENEGNLKKVLWSNLIDGGTLSDLNIPEIDWDSLTEDDTYQDYEDLSSISPIEPGVKYKIKNGFYYTSVDDIWYSTNQDTLRYLYNNIYCNYSNNTWIFHRLSEIETWNDLKEYLSLYFTDLVTSDPNKINLYYTYIVPTYLMEYYSFEYPENTILQNIISIIPQFRETQNILTESIDEDNWGIEIWSKSIGKGDPEYDTDQISLTIEYFSNTNTYRFTITRFSYSEVFEGVLNPGPGERRLDYQIDQESKLIHIRFDDIKNGLRTGSWILRGSETEEVGPDEYWNSFNMMIYPGSVCPDYFLIPDKSFWTEDISDPKYFETFLYYSREYSFQFLIQNETSPYMILYGDKPGRDEINEIPPYIIVYDGEKFWRNNNGTLIEEKDKNTLEIAEFDGDFIYNYLNDYENRLIYFYQTMTIGGKTRPGYYLYLRGLFVDDYSMSTSIINYDTTFIDNPYLDINQETVLSNYKCNYLVDNNHFYFYKRYQNGESYISTSWMRFAIGRITREFQRNRSKYLGERSPLKVRQAINKMLTGIVSRFSIIYKINLTNFSINYTENRLDVSLETYIKDLADKNIGLDITINYNN